MDGPTCLERNFIRASDLQARRASDARGYKDGQSSRKGDDKGSLVLKGSRADSPSSSRSSSRSGAGGRAPPKIRRLLVMREATVDPWGWGGRIDLCHP